MLVNLDVFGMFPSTKSVDRRFAFLHRVLQGEFPCFNGTIKALRLPAVHPAALRCLRLAVPPAFTRSIRSPTDECAAGAWSWSPGISSRDFAEETKQDLPSSWGISIIRLHMFIDAGRTADTRPLRCSNAALGACKAKAPTIGLSTLNRMAFGLAVYASQCGLLQPHARLAPGYWSGFTGRASHPQDSAEKFQICFLTSHPPFPSFLAQTRPPEQFGIEPLPLLKRRFCRAIERV